MNILFSNSSRDFYATDDDGRSHSLRCVPAGGFAPKRTHFVARVTSNGEVNVIDERYREALINWLGIEKICLAAAQAAEDGRFCFTNGNNTIWVEDGFLVFAELQPLNTTRLPLDHPDSVSYLRSTAPHSSRDTAFSLRSYAESKMEIAR